jgi:hypothetical protein
MLDKLEKTLSAVEEDLKGEPGEAQTSKPEKRSKKVAKKVTKKDKKSEKKAAKSNGSTEGKVTLADLASEAKITGASARRKLRDAELSRDGRWAWEDGSKALKDARKALGLD